MKKSYENESNDTLEPTYYSTIVYSWDDPNNIYEMHDHFRGTSNSTDKPVIMKLQDTKSPNTSHDVGVFKSQTVSLWANYNGWNSGALKKGPLNYASGFS